jgi:hypothetical protein
MWLKCDCQKYNKNANSPTNTSKLKTYDWILVLVIKLKLSTIVKKMLHCVIEHGKQILCDTSLNKPTIRLVKNNFLNVEYRSKKMTKWPNKSIQLQYFNARTGAKLVKFHYNER